MCDARETGASARNARKKRDFLKDEAKQKQEKKKFKGQ
jgi:hypothetical protein